MPQVTTKKHDRISQKYSADNIFAGINWLEKYAYLTSALRKEMIPIYA